MLRLEVQLLYGAPHKVRKTASYKLIGLVCLETVTKSYRA
jgi:hypothetical protein